MKPLTIKILTGLSFVLNSLSQVSLPELNYFKLSSLDCFKNF